ncbi:unnamed protein product [Laminaria digitata]
MDPKKRTRRQVPIGAPRSLQVIGVQRRQRTDHTTLSYAKALKKTRYESIVVTIRQRRLFLAGVVARQHNGRLPSRVMFATITDGERSRPGRPQ